MGHDIGVNLPTFHMAKWQDTATGPLWQLLKLRYSIYDHGLVNKDPRIDINIQNVLGNVHLAMGKYPPIL